MRQINPWSWIIFWLELLIFSYPFSLPLNSACACSKISTVRSIPGCFSRSKILFKFWILNHVGGFDYPAQLNLIVTTAYWVHWKTPKLRPVVEFITLMPFVVPAVVLTFGMIRMYGSPPIVLIGSPVLLIAGYIILSLPYMYRAVDTGLRVIDVRTLTEAALSLGAGWRTILFRVIFPNLRVAILSGVFLTFAIVMGEFTFASLLAWPAFGPYMEEIGAMRAYTPQALAVVSFLLTWASIGLLQFIGRRAGQEQIAGAH